MKITVERDTITNNVTFDFQEINQGNIISNVLDIIALTRNFQTTKFHSETDNCVQLKCLISNLEIKKTIQALELNCESINFGTGLKSSVKQIQFQTLDDGKGAFAVFTNEVKDYWVEVTLFNSASFQQKIEVYQQIDENCEGVEIVEDNDREVKISIPVEEDYNNNYWKVLDSIMRSRE